MTKSILAAQCVCSYTVTQTLIYTPRKKVQRNFSVVPEQICHQNLHKQAQGLLFHYPIVSKLPRVVTKSVLAAQCMCSYTHRAAQVETDVATGNST